ncbi:hypothetical protein GGQ04_002910 [Salinibacter ruber]|uniref:hypothetical protein n=1 Tax=Salinibacter ruber TaxID=146919 RepID=UPI00216721FB|nr:hypothetical protein [Salinibacter ruber]MCS4047761.1 hypothetical protein [Salinibacter ruber]
MIPKTKTKYTHARVKGRNKEEEGLTRHTHKAKDRPMILSRQKMKDELPYEPKGLNGELREDELEFLFTLEMTNEIWLSNKPVRKKQARKIKRLMKKNDVSGDLNLEKVGLGRYSLTINLN